MHFIDVNVIYEDCYLIVINKFINIKVHSSSSRFELTMLNFLLYNYPYLESLPRCGIVHRLDKNTSGLLLIAKGHQSAVKLTGAFKDRIIKKVYLAVLLGIPRKLSGTPHQLEP